MPADSDPAVKRRSVLVALGLGLATSLPAAAAWRYRVGLDPAAGLLTVAACGDRALASVRFVAANRRAAAALRAPRRDSGADELTVAGARLHARDWRPGECLHYAVDLAAATGGERWAAIRATDRYWLVSPTRWLWRPDRLAPDTTLRLALPDGWSASLPWRPTGRGGEYRLGPTPPEWPALTAFGRFQEQPVDLPGGRLRVAVLPGGDGTGGAGLHAWVAATARHLLTAYGRMPLPDAQLLVVPVPGSRSPAPWAEVARGGGTAIHLYAGTGASAAARAADWTLTHELAHLLHPWLGGRGRWLSEGLGSYYQNVLRARAGVLAAEDAWRRLDAGFARGRRGTPSGAAPLAEASGGRAGTMRLYWSGAAFWLEADLALRERGDSLDALLGRFAERHLPTARRWSPEQFVAALDALIGAPLLLPRLHRYAAERDFPDLSAAYLRLGLARDGRGVLRFQPAPASAIRAAIMAPPAQSRATPGKPST